MGVFAVNDNGDWDLNTIKVGNNEIIQNVLTRMKEWVNDCFFAKDSGINWNIYIGGSKNLESQLKTDMLIVLQGTVGVIGGDITRAEINGENIIIDFNVITKYSNEAILFNDLLL